MEELRYPVGIQNFSEIRRKGFVYVDKTQYIHRLVSSSKYIFLSRPRRFGKSLLLSTIETYFQGKSELFNGLAIARYNPEWNEYPVLHLDFTGADYNVYDGFRDRLNSIFRIWERQYGVEGDDITDFGVRFGQIIRAAHMHTGRQVVILVDEYDKPLLETVDNEPLQEQYRNSLRGVYGNLKGQDEHIRFAMLTGVTRFGHLSVFSDLNNLEDISMDQQYAGICGITKDELNRYFGDGIKVFASCESTSEEYIYEQLKRKYDGYHFAPKYPIDVYNPFSVLNALKYRDFGDYWFRSGTPTFLIKMIRSGKLPLRKLNSIQTSVRSLSDVSFNLSNWTSVLYQSGYLTIKDYDKEFEMATLGFPNMEVERGFLNSLLSVYTSIEPDETEFSIRNFVMDIRDGNVEAFMQRLQSLFSDFKYDAFDLRNLEHSTKTRTLDSWMIRRLQ